MRRLLQFAVRWLSVACATGALLSLLLAGAVLAAPHSDYSESAAPAVSQMEFTAYQADPGDCAAAPGKSSCCGATCVATLMPRGSLTVSIGAGGRYRLKTSDAIAGIEPDGLQRPPKLA